MEYNLTTINPLICLSCVGGSKAYGLATPQSDDDVKGIYLARPVDVLAGRAPAVVQDAGHDVQYTEFGEFCRQLELNNSGALELWACIGQRQQLHCAEWLPAFFEGRSVLSKRCYHTYVGNALAQMKRIHATHDKAVQEPPRAATLQDFSTVLDGGAVWPLSDWLARCGLSLHEVAARPVSSGVWALHRQSSRTGLFGADGTGVARVSIAESAPFLAYMVVDSAAFSEHCRRVKQYREWLEKRNAARLTTSAHLPREEGQYDVKHMAHVVRLLHTAREIATEGRIHVWRTHDNALLRRIRAGLLPFSELVAMVESEIRELKPLFERSSLPESPHMGDWAGDLAELRIRLYHG